MEDIVGVDRLLGSANMQNLTFPCPRFVPILVSNWDHFVVYYCHLDPILWDKLQYHLQITWPEIGCCQEGHLCRARREVGQEQSPVVRLMWRVLLENIYSFGSPRNQLIHFNVLPLTPWVESLTRNFRWLYLSKALLKSSKTKSTWWPRVSCLPRSSTSWINCVSQERFSRKPCWS